MKQNGWLYSIKLLCALLVIPGFFSCNRVRKVEVFVYDATTGSGISGITLFFNEEEYITDSQGKVEIKKMRNIKGESVSTFVHIPNYINADYLNTCLFKNVYEIESENLKIPLLRLKKLRLSFNKIGGPSGEKEDICVQVSESVLCKSGSFVTLRVLNDNIVQSNNLDNGAYVFAFASPNGELFIDFNYEHDCGYQTAPDTTYTVPIDANSDTTSYVLHYK